MARFYEVFETTDNLTAEELEKGQTPRRAFRGTRGKAKQLGREWNGGKALRTASPVYVREHNVTGGKPGLLAWLNALVGGVAEVTARPVTGTGGKTPRRTAAEPAQAAKKGKPSKQDVQKATEPEPQPPKKIAAKKKGK